MANREETQRISELNCCRIYPWSRFYVMWFTVFSHDVGSIWKTVTLTMILKSIDKIWMYPADILTFQGTFSGDSSLSDWLQLWFSKLPIHHIFTSILSVFVGLHNCARENMHILCLCVCWLVPDRGGSCSDDWSTGAPWRGHWRVLPYCCAVREEQGITKRPNVINFGKRENGLQVSVRLTMMCDK